MRSKQELEESKRKEIVFFERLIESLREKKSKLDFNICGFMAMEGHLHNRELMVVGRALNGGASCLNPCKDITNAEKISAFYQETIEDSVKDGEPMRWVVSMWGSKPEYNYNTKRSAFWRVIRQVTGDLKIADIENDDWSSYLVWSNLFKIAPKNSGNPSGLLKRIQKDVCIELLSCEFSVYKPKRVLFLTGQDWFDSEFKDTLRERKMFQLPKEFEYVQEAGIGTHSNGENFKYAVSPHPQGKREGCICKEIVDSFTSLVL